jgi:hypothetical protein
MVEENVLKTIELYIFFFILLKIVEHGISKTTSTLKIRQLTLSSLLFMPSNLFRLPMPLPIPCSFHA